MKKWALLSLGFMIMGCALGCSPTYQAHVVVPLRGLVVTAPGTTAEIGAEDFEGVVLNVVCEVRENGELRKCKIAGIPQERKIWKGGQI